MNIVTTLKKNPIIFAARHDRALIKAADGKCEVIFLLKTDLITAKKSVAYAHDRGKRVFVHLDLMDGIGRDEIAVKYVAEHIRPDGIITTKAPLVKAAKACGLLTVFRAFLVDSQGLETAMHSATKVGSDFVEIMPGVIPSAIRKFAELELNLIAGGLITSRADVEAALSAGAIAVSTSCEDVFEKD